MSDKPVTLPRLATEPDERDGYEWNVHLVEADRPHMRICFMSNGPHSEAYANLLVSAANERPSLQAQLAAARSALEEISSPTQSTNLLWWQIKARAALRTLAQNPTENTNNATVAQSVEPAAHNGPVAGSSPAGGTTLAQEPAGQSEALADLVTFAAKFPEINPGNYDDFDVEAINNWGLEVCAEIVRLAAHPTAPAGSASPGVNDEPVAWRLTWPDGCNSYHSGSSRPKAVRGISLTPLYAHPTVKVSGDAAEMLPEDMQLLWQLHRDNTPDGTRPVIESQGWEQAMRLSDAGYIAIEQLATGGCLHITRKGIRALPLSPEGRS